MRILIADEQPKVRFALRVLLDRQPDLEIVGETADADGLLALTRSLCPELVLLHWRLLDAGTAGLLTELRRMCPDVCLIVLSARPEVRREALIAGADAFVSKMDQPDQLLAAVRSAAKKDNDQLASAGYGWSISLEDPQQIAARHSSPRPVGCLPVQCLRPMAGGEG
jgi:DNA-binding NarL/FixJ family response regulator